MSAADPADARPWEHWSHVPPRLQRRVGRLVARTRARVARGRSKRTEAALRRHLRCVGLRYGLVLDVLDVRRHWIETVEREDLYDVLAALVREELHGYRGSVDELVQAAWDGVDRVRTW